ncbi:sensor domain-containing diguanylate cyclase [Alkalicoccobacillus murimartini]|uniref:Diguanylate cyclase (GGDEF)-like protein n=1 Tax=Alkalicoccobacillus murimartini TaxID=171685 RepID=A0ABT9YKZ2_9BACI|nr:diguanylate cyclase [Alkalicoccobacillus murimartini]MDQ0208140.1 diguanylate cyclase (GGDEF)-like protein [Alkalicoccobacillus murimartini]
MTGVQDIFYNEDYSPLWEKVVLSEEGPINPKIPLILTLRSENGFVSAKQIGASSEGLRSAFTFYSQNHRELPIIDYDQDYTYIETLQKFPTRIGLVTQMVAGDLKYYTNLLEWVHTMMFQDTPFSLTAEQLLAGANYRIQFNSLIDSLVLNNKELGSPITFSLLERQDTEFKHKSGWETKKPLLIKVGERIVTRLINDHRTSTELFTYSGSITDDGQSTQHVIVPLMNQGNCFACLIASTNEEYQDSLETFKQTSKWLSLLLQKGYQADKDENEAKKKDLLLEVTKKFHSTMDISEVLAKIVYAIKQTYPSFSVYLMLSHEWEVREELPIKPLIYGAEGMNTKAEHAFLTGIKQVDKDRRNQIVHLFVPLRGKQGIYGVLEVRAIDLETLPEEEISFIEMLADTGGNALENAELYQQSRDLIHDLKLINKATHQINMNLNLNDLIESMTNQIQEAFSAQEVGFLLFDRNDSSVIHQSGTEFFESTHNVEQLHSLIQQILHKKDPIYIGDTGLHQDIETGSFRSLLAIPMLQNQTVHGLVFVLHQESYFFTFETFKLLQSLVHHSTLAFTNTLLHEELEKLVITDHLTNLHSRNHLEASMDQSLLEHENGTFLLIDIDDFKSINDTYGHQIGDEIIVQVANVIRSNIRETDIAARWGGEELAIYLPTVKLDIGTDIAKRIVKAVALETNPSVTISCGVSYWDKNKSDTRSSASLFKDADAGLYKAKYGGKNQVFLSEL